MEAFKYSTLAVIFLMAINSISAPKFAEFHGSNDIKIRENSQAFNKNDF